MRTAFSIQSSAFGVQRTALKNLEHVANLFFVFNAERLMPNAEHNSRRIQWG